MRTFVGDDEFVQPKRDETAPRSECRFTFKNALTQPRLLEMDVEPASRKSCSCRPACPTCRLFVPVERSHAFRGSVSALNGKRNLQLPLPVSAIDLILKDRSNYLRILRDIASALLFVA